MTERIETTIAKNNGHLTKARIADLRKLATDMSMGTREIDSHLVFSASEPIGSNRYIQQARKEIFDLWSDLQVECETKKGRISSLLRLFPEDFRINQPVFKIEDKEEVRAQIIQCISNGKVAGLRTCYSDQSKHFGEAPWVMGIKTPEQVAAFFGDIKIDKKIPAWREPNVKGHQTYERWQKEAKNGLREVIVMENPPELEGKMVGDHFFAFRAFAYSLENFQIELRDNTPQLRSIEGGTPRQKLIEIHMPVRPNHYGIYMPSEPVVYAGSEYSRSPSLGVDSSTYKSQADKLRRDGIKWFNQEDESLRSLLNPVTRATIDRVVKFVYFDSCSNPYNHLYYNLVALSEAGLQAVEFQGMHGNGTPGWIKAYGFRGTRE